MSDAGSNEWSSLGTRQSARAPFTWNALLWSLIYPRRGQRILPTVPGVMLISLSIGIGTAAYNSSSNILFITLSLLLACLILSGVLSWLNMRGVLWRLRLAPPLRAGHDTIISLELRNAKSFLPTYGLWFDLSARAVEPAGNHRPESTWSDRSANVRAALAKADTIETEGRVGQPGRLEPKGEGRIDWLFKPEKRGVLRVRLVSVGSLFPFGFLRKDVGTEVSAETVVWPAPVEYRRHAVTAARRTTGGERVARAGNGNDLLALRRYTTGDSHRLIHWKASARTRQLLVRQHAAESAEGYAIWLQADSGRWTQPEQFELLVSFVATLAEDLFRGGRLTSVAINGEPPQAVRRIHDLELFMDKLALVRPENGAGPGGVGSVAKQNVMTFAPDGARGVAAYVDGQQAATA